MNSRREAERIRNVYEHYDSSPAEQRKRDRSNRGNVAMARERSARLAAALTHHFGGREDRVRCLDVGCGRGDWLGWLATLGYPEREMVGVDLLPDRVAEARAALPTMRFECMDAVALPYISGSFDLLVSATVFSSIIDAEVAAAVGDEMRRCLAPGGAVLWYDIRYPNPSNPNVRAVTRKDIARLFPGTRQELRTMTLLPPIARRLEASIGAYRIFASIPLLRSHLGGLLLHAG